MPGVLRYLLVVGVLLTVSDPVQADPILITGGHVVFRAEGPGSMGLFGPGGTLGGVLFGGGSPLVACSPCPPGNAVQLSGSIVTSDVIGSIALETLRADNVLFDVAIHIVGPTLLVPAIPRDAFAVTGSTGSITVSGSLAAFAREGSDLHRGALLTTANFSGEGAASWRFIRAPGSDSASWVDVRYDFKSPEPVPEPATLGIVIIGGAGFAAAARRTKRRPEKG